MTTPKEELKGLYIEIEKDFHKQLKAQSVLEERSMKEIIVHATTQYLQSQK